MKSAHPPINTFYEKYKDYGILPLAMPAICVMVVVNTIGILANTIVIIITASSKNLRCMANYLLAMQCFFDSLHVLAHFYLAYLLYSGTNFNNLSTCFKIMIVPLIGTTFGMSLTFFTAFDRLISTLFPIRHPRLNKLLYLGSIVAICMGYSMYLLYLGYVNAVENKELMVVCLVTEAIHGPPLNVLSFTTAALVFGSVAIYVIIGITIHYKINSSTTTKKLFKSLLILCTLMICSWALTSISAIVSFKLRLSEELSFFIPFYLGITINVACGSNLFVLTRYSSEYRTATREFFKKYGITIFSKPTHVPSRIFKKTSIPRLNISIVPRETSFCPQKTPTIH